MLYQEYQVVHTTIKEYLNPTRAFDDTIQRVLRYEDLDKAKDEFAIHKERSDKDVEFAEDHHQQTHIYHYISLNKISHTEHSDDAEVLDRYMVTYSPDGTVYDDFSTYDEVL